MVYSVSFDPAGAISVYESYDPDTMYGDRLTFWEASRTEKAKTQFQRAWNLSINDSVRIPRAGMYVLRPKASFSAFVHSK
jgi:hypothetical protein